MVVPGADSKLSSLSFKDASNISCQIKRVRNEKFWLKIFIKNNEHNNENKFTNQGADIQPPATDERKYTDLYDD